MFNIIFEILKIQCSSISFYTYKNNLICGSGRYIFHNWRSNLKGFFVSSDDIERRTKATLWTIGRNPKGKTMRTVFPGPSTAS